MACEYDVILIGSGMGSLSTASLLANQGVKVLILEQNYLPGGCTSSYWRKGYVFESGATTLVGLDEGMPLKFLLDKLGIQIPAIKLELPMQVHLEDGTLVNRYENPDVWIGEAERVFGKQGQREFWQTCFDISQFVWSTSTRQLTFPPENVKDLVNLIKNSSWQQSAYLPYAFRTVNWLLKKYNLHAHERFVRFIDQQLLITAQNYSDQVNLLFGATALCYTNYGNYYLKGGMISLVNFIIGYLQSKGGEIHLREPVVRVVKDGHAYKVVTTKDEYTSRVVVSGLPINNTVNLFGPEITVKKFFQLGSKDLWSAFQMGIGFKNGVDLPSLHHQVILKDPLPLTGSNSFFVSFNHISDSGRTDQEGHRVASVSTHIKNPQEKLKIDKEPVQEAILKELEKRKLITPDSIVYKHGSGPGDWQKWTGRAYGFVGGYPQIKHIYPWQMNGSRLDGKGAYICGDTTYPGQGIPGTVLSGIITFEKIKRDWFS